jgi:ethanolamine utilization protein EutP (predicted NTPase)
MWVIGECGLVPTGQFTLPVFEASMDDKTAKRVLTKALEALSTQAVTQNDDGEIITRAERLAELVWQYALGFTDTDVKTGKEVVHRPATWAIHLLFDRMEGRVVTKIVTKGKDKVSVADRVSELSKTSINRLAE